MSDYVNLALYLICHHGHSDEVVKDAEVIRRTSIEKHIPITYFFSGIEINALNENRGRICYELGTDVVGAIQSDLFINPRFGQYDKHKSELGIMPFHHAPLVQPWGQDLWSEYFEGFLKDEIRWGISVTQQYLLKTPVTIHPPDGVYAPSVAHTLRQLGLDTVVVSGEFLGDNKHAKGVTYQASGLRHLVRTNDIQPNSSEFCNAERFADAVQNYARQNDISTLAVGCDIDEFNGMRRLSLRDGIARLCCIGDETYKHGISMVNCNAASFLNLYQADIAGVWSWNDVHAMIHADGNLGWVDGNRNALVNYMISLVRQRYKEGWDVRQAKHHLAMSYDIALRNRYFNDPRLTDYFYGNINAARRLLQG